MSVEKIERILDAIDKIDDMSDEEIVKTTTSILIFQYGDLTTGEFIKTALLPFLSSNVDSLRGWLEIYREKNLKELRFALKRRKRDITIIRK